jgi:hypothetical protein
MNDDRFSQIDPESLEQMRKMFDQMDARGENSRAEEMRVILDSLDVRTPNVAAKQGPHETRAQRRARERAEAKQARRKAA